MNYDNKNIPLQITNSKLNDFARINTSINGISADYVRREPGQAMSRMDGRLRDISRFDLSIGQGKAELAKVVKESAIVAALLPPEQLAIFARVNTSINGISADYIQKQSGQIVTRMDSRLSDITRFDLTTGKGKAELAKVIKEVAIVAALLPPEQLAIFARVNTSINGISADYVRREPGQAMSRMDDRLQDVSRFDLSNSRGKAELAKVVKETVIVAALLK